MSVCPSIQIFKGDDSGCIVFVLGYMLILQKIKKKNSKESRKKSERLMTDSIWMKSLKTTIQHFQLYLQDKNKLVCKWPFKFIQHMMKEQNTQKRNY